MSISRDYESPLCLATEEPGVYVLETPTDDARAAELLPEQTESAESSGHLYGVWDDDTLVGAVRTANDESEAKTGAITFGLDPDFTGCGYATLAVRAITAHGLTHYRKLRATTDAQNTRAAAVLRRSGYIQSPTSDTELQFETQDPELAALTTAVIKMRATNGSEGGLTDSANLDFESGSLERLIKKASGSKNRALQTALEAAIAYLQTHPLDSASERLVSLGSREPTINGGRISLWRLKPSMAPDLKFGSLLHGTRIIYGLVDNPQTDSKTLAIFDIIARGDFAKKYN